MAGMVSASHWIAAVVLVGGGCLLPRRVARTPLRWSPWLLADAALPAATALLILALSGRPIFTGAVTFALCGGYAFADRSKRRVLAEPVVFTDVFQAVDIFRHPELALPFPHKGRVAAGCAAALAFFLAVFLLDPPVAAWWPWRAAALLLGVGGSIYLLAGPFNAAAGRLLRLGGMRGDPVADGRRAGPLATLAGHGIIARAERHARQEAAYPAAKGVDTSTPTAPLVLVQSESFFDARRLHRGIRRDLLPAFDRLCHGGVQWGRLSVPSWGANTVRTEFSVLSGMGNKQLGLDCFNPYHRFVNRPVSSLAWQLKAQGYLTVCIHPFDLRFYGRDRVMPNLGFDLVLGEEHFAGAERVNGYVSDIEVARAADRLLREHGPRTFVFIVTMENHGPWTGRCDGPLEGLAPGLSLPEEQRHALQRYLLSLRNADAMLQILAEAVERTGPAGVLCFYGDHLPAFSSLFRQCALDDLRTDYLIWKSQRQAGQRIDIDASGLAQALLRALQNPAFDQAGNYRQIWS